MFSFHRLALVGMFGALVSHTATAADMSFGMAPPPPVQLDEARVELGTGWYLRGDAAWSRENTPKLFPDMTLSTESKGSNGWVAGLGVGYKFNNWMRADLTYDLRNTLKADSKSDIFDCPSAVAPVNDASNTPVGWQLINGRCEEMQKASVKRHTVMLNAYVDLGTWSRVTPYVGAGVGVTAGRARGEADWWFDNKQHYEPDIQPPTANFLPWVGASPPPGFSLGLQNKYRTYSRSMYNFTYALMAGVAVDVSSNAKVDLGYRYIDMGRFGQNGSGDKSTAHEYRVGLRYMVD